MVLRRLCVLWLCLLPCLGAAEPLVPPTLKWDYTAAAPDSFVIRRSLDGGVTWQEVATLPGTQGTGLTWQDTTLVAGAVPLVAHYAVAAVKHGESSDPSNRAITTRGGHPRVPTARVKIVAADSEETTAAQNQARLAGDGLPASLWHTQYSGTAAPLPHWIVLDLGAITSVDGLAYLPRQAGGKNGTIREYDVAVSPDNTTWSAPVAAGTWLWGTAPLEQYVRWAPVEARYVRLRALKEVSGGPWTSAAEIGLYAGAGTPGPAGVALGSCVLTTTGDKGSVITCTQP